ALTGGISLLTGALAVIWAEIKASEVRQQEALKAMEARQREDMKASEVRQQEVLKAMEARQREEMREMREYMKASEARQREEMREMREYMKALGENVDRLAESMMTVRK
ncbi:MAG: hypothetical protein OXF67_07330, partial [Cyanobacteria bacterium MAG CAR4_bin_6]|nr:hypothetical protein [Cyanobacteria bacterium MAG CAR4_bin_6]